MNTSDFIACLALVVASGAFFLELRRWFEDGPKIHLAVMSDVVTVPADDGRAKLALTVVNRGTVPTTITHMIGVSYTGLLSRWRDKPTMQGIVNTQLMPLPFQLGVNKSFMGMMNYEERTAAAREQGSFYVGVVCSHSSKRYLIRVQPPKTDVPTEVL